MTTEEQLVERERLEDLLDMFARPGWRLFQEEFADNADLLDNVRGVKDGEALCRVKGMLEVYDYLLSYEDSVRLALDETDI